MTLKQKNKTGKHNIINGKRVYDKFFDAKGKVCGACDEYKEYSEYYKVSGKEVYRTQCKQCIAEKSKAKYKVDGERMKERARKNYEKNKHLYKERKRKYYKANKEAYKARLDKYMQDPEFVANKKARAKAWEERNREKINKRKRTYKKNRRNSDPVYKIKCNIRCRLHKILKNKGYKKHQNTIDFVGCNWETLWGHLGGTFEANYGMPREWLSSFEYEIDHIIPLSSAATLEEVVKLNHYTNLQILTKEDNRKKSASLDWSL